MKMSDEKKERERKRERARERNYLTVNCLWSKSDFQTDTMTQTGNQTNCQLLESTQYNHCPFLHPKQKKQNSDAINLFG